MIFPLAAGPGGPASGVVFEQHAVNQFQDNGFFLRIKLGDRLEAASSLLPGPRSPGLNTSESIVTLRVTAVFFNASSDGWALPDS